MRAPGCVIMLLLSASSSVQGESLAEDESLTETWLARLAAQKAAKTDLGLPGVAGDKFVGFPFKPFSSAYVKKALAEGVDWRTKNAVTPVKSQGSHGVCGTFGQVSDRRYVVYLCVECCLLFGYMT